MKLSKSQKLNIRDKFISNFSEHIIGPQDGETEFVKGELSNKYLCGMLFSRNVSRDSTNLDDDADNLERTEDDKSSEFSLSDAYESLPSSIGISVFLTVAKSKSTPMLLNIIRKYLKLEKLVGEELRSHLNAPQRALKLIYQA